MLQDPGEVSLGWQGCPLCHDFHIWLPCYVSCCMFQKCLAEPSGMIVCSLRICACCSGSAGYRRQSYLPGDGCDQHVGLVIFCADEWLCEAV